MWGSIMQHVRWASFTETLRQVSGAKQKVHIRPILGGHYNVFGFWRTKLYDEEVIKLFKYSVLE